MATNVYRSEERVYYSDEPAVQQGYHISTSFDAYSIYLGEDTWEQAERAARNLGVNPEEAVRLAGLLVAYFHGEPSWREFAEEKLKEELSEEAFGRVSKAMFDYCEGGMPAFNDEVEDVNDER